MYAYFKGTVDKSFKDRIIIEVNNIGYNIYMPESEILNIKPGDEIKVYTYFNVREDEMKLYGFLAYETLEFFKKLIGVSGVGPKVALGIISNVTTSDMCIAIATDNISALRQIPGIGPKMAQKIIFELKDKISNEELLPNNKNGNQKIINNANEQEAITALQVLGYTLRQIKDVMCNINTENCTVEEIIKKVLKQMQKM